MPVISKKEKEKERKKKLQIYKSKKKKELYEKTKTNEQKIKEKEKILINKLINSKNKESIKKIKKYLSFLKKKIHENINNSKTYILLDLSNNKIDELSDLLHNKSVLSYLLINFNINKALINKITVGEINITDDEWGLSITGFLEQIPYKNEQKVVHKVGLVAYKIKNYEQFKKKFKSRRFYTSHKDSYKIFDINKINKRAEKIYDSMTNYLESKKKNKYNYVLTRKINKNLSNGYTTSETSSETNNTLSNKVKNKNNQTNKNSIISNNSMANKMANKTKKIKSSNSKKRTYANVLRTGLKN